MRLHKCEKNKLGAEESSHVSGMGNPQPSLRKPESKHSHAQMSLTEQNFYPEEKILMRT